MNAKERLDKLGIVLPDPVSPSASYVPYLRTGEYLYVSGQVPKVDGQDRYVGQLGAGLTLEEGIAAARVCGINILAQVNAALEGDLDRVVRCIRLGGFVNAVPQFGDQPKVVNGASDLMLAVFGEAGKHVRVAVGVSSLPRGVGVEVEALFQVR